MLRLHHLPNSRSQRVVWLLEELQIPYEIIIHGRSGPQQLADPSLAAVHPLGKAPVIQDGDITLAETGAILDYLITAYGKAHYKPMGDVPSWRDYLYWVQAGDASLMPYLAMAQSLHRFDQSLPWPLSQASRWLHTKFASQYWAPNLGGFLRAADQHLAKHRYFAGTFGPCDVLLEFMFNAMLGKLINHDSVPHISQWLQQVQSREAYKTALQKGQWKPAEFLRQWAFLRHYSHAVFSRVD